MSRLRSSSARMVLVQLPQSATSCSCTATQVIPFKKYEWLRDSKSIIWNWILHSGSLLRFLLLAVSPVFPVSAYQEKVRITNHNNDNNDNPFRKKWRSSRCCVATSTYLYDTERRSRRVKQFVSYGFVCCQENESCLTSVFPKVILSPSICMCDWLPTDLDRKTFTFYKLNLNPWTPFFKKKWKITCCHLPILLLELEWYTHLCKGCGMLFRDWDLLLPVYVAFPNCFHFTISSLTLCPCLLYCSSEPWPSWLAG